MTEGNGERTRLNAAVENVWAKLIARYAMPLIIAVVGSGGTLVLKELLATSRETQAFIGAVRTEVAVIGEQIKQDRESVKAIADRLRSDVDSTARLTGQRLDEHERRITQHDRQIDLLNGRHLP